mmetsp:Transcript_66086/g.184044  ORF Transcript_66086/g.184044 Transcript_66086/m.184044 type:complete len:297 (+) Transcript_66086:230-1120(+)
MVSPGSNSRCFGPCSPSGVLATRQKRPTAPSATMYSAASVSCPSSRMILPFGMNFGSLHWAIAGKWCVLMYRNNLTPCKSTSFSSIVNDFHGSLTTFGGSVNQPSSSAKVFVSSASPSRCALLCHDTSEPCRGLGRSASTSLLCSSSACCLASKLRSSGEAVESLSSSASSASVVLWSSATLNSGLSKSLLSSASGGMALRSLPCRYVNAPPRCLGAGNSCTKDFSNPNANFGGNRSISSKRAFLRMVNALPPPGLSHTTLVAASSLQTVWNSCTTSPHCSTWPVRATRKVPSATT